MGFIPPFGSPPTLPATSTVQGKLVLANDLGGVATAPTVVATHLVSALPVLQGGTGVTTSTGTGNIVLSDSPTLTGLPIAPTQTPADNSTKIATTAYVDSAVLGQNFKEAVRVATTSNLVGVYVNGASGVGATFTYTATGVDTIDGVTLALGDRVLLKNQTTTFQNGIYTVTTAGAIGVAGVLTRGIDADQPTDFKTGDSVLITAGTTLSTTTWAYNGIDSPTIGTTALTYVQTAGQGSFTAGNGISITGVSIAIDTTVTADKTTAQALTNKDLTGAGNTFPTLNQDTTGKSAKTDALNSATTVVNVSSATAPTANQVLTATSGTAATWQTPSSTTPAGSIMLISQVFS